MNREPCTVAFEAEALPPAILELFEHCVRHGLYGDADRESLLAMYRLDPGATCDLVGEMAARVLRCRRCRHFRRPGLADSGYCAGAREDLPVVYGLLHALPPDGGAWCPRFASTEARP